MKNKGILAILVLSFFSNKAMESLEDGLLHNISACQVADNQEKPKIVILFCKGGGGHISASQAIQSYFKHEDYTVSVVDALGDVCAVTDPIYTLTQEKYTGQDLYNTLLQKNYKRTLNLYYKIGTFLVQKQQKILESLFNNLIDQEQPNLIISVIPFINGIVARVAQKNKIPFLIIPTDFDVKGFVDGVNKSNNATTILGISHEEKNALQVAQKADLKDKKVAIIGFPLRKIFFKKYENENLTQLSENGGKKPTILLVMGAVGSSSLITYLQCLKAVKTPLHIIVAVGRSIELKKQIQSMKFPASLSYMLITHEDNIAQAMAASDLCITKCGSVTFAEVIYSQLPVFLDATLPALAWEKFNIHIAEKYGFGRAITSYNAVVPIVTKFFEDETMRTAMKTAFVALTFPQCKQELKKLTATLI